LVPGLRPFVLVRDYECRVDRVTQILFGPRKHESRNRPLLAAQPIAHWGQSMSALRSLTFTTMPKIGANPTLDRRTNIIARLEE
jgi:hypothetical protein